MRLALKMEILASGKSQRHFSAAIGISENRLSEIVRGWCDPRREEMDLLAAALNRPVEVLFGIDAVRTLPDRCFSEAPSAQIADNDAPPAVATR